MGKTRSTKKSKKSRKLKTNYSLNCRKTRKFRRSKRNCKSNCRKSKKIGGTNPCDKFNKYLVEIFKLAYNSPLNTDFLNQIEEKIEKIKGIESDLDPQMIKERFQQFIENIGRGKTANNVLISLYNLDLIIDAQKNFCESNIKRIFTFVNNYKYTKFDHNMQPISYSIDYEIEQVSDLVNQLYYSFSEDLQKKFEDIKPHSNGDNKYGLGDAANGQFFDKPKVNNNNDLQLNKFLLQLLFLAYKKHYILIEAIQGGLTAENEEIKQTEIGQTILSHIKQSPGSARATDAQPTRKPKVNPRHGLVPLGPDLRPSKSDW